MHGRIILLSLLVVIPIIAFAQTTNNLQARAQDLLNRVKAFQVKAASTPACPAITGNLKRGSSGAQVKNLQEFLAKDPTVYPEALVTSTYGPATEAAVKRWQVKYDVVASGDAATTGFGSVGPKTIAAIKQKCSGSVASVAVASPNAGGLISVAPATGGAPLTVAVQAVANTAHVCGGAIYGINYGDGSPQSQITVPANQCGEVAQAFSHVYRNRGTYQITLSSGNHYTSV